MATDKDKGIAGAAQNALRQTTGALRGEGPWYSANSDVYLQQPLLPDRQQHGPRER